MSGYAFRNWAKHWLWPPKPCVRIAQVLLALIKWFWRSIPSYLPFYLVFVVAIYGGWFGRQEMTVIAAFHVPPMTKETNLPFGEQTVANVLSDAMTSVRKEADGQPAPPPCDSLTQHKSEFGGLASPDGLTPSEVIPVEVPTGVSAEVRGISVAALISLAREALRRERVITGDVIFETNNSFRLLARRGKDEGPWRTDPYPTTFAGLQEASCSLAEQVVKSIAPDVMAVVLIRREQYRAAADLYRGVHLSRANRPQNHNNLGLALFMLGERERAIAEYEKAISFSKGRFPKAHYNLGNALMGKRDLYRAIAEYREALRQRPGYPEAHNNLGYALTERHDMDGAAAEFREALRLKPDYPGAHNNLGNALMSKGDLDEAIAEFHEALRLKPDYAGAHSNLGNALMLLKHKPDVDGAIAEYREALRLRPDYAEARTNLGTALAVTGDLDGAIAEYRKALRLKPDYAGAHNNLGNALMRKGDLGGAIAQYREALRLSPNYPEAHYSLGVALARRGDVDRAVAEYREALRLKPDYDKAQLGLTELLARKAKRESKH